MKIEKVNDNQIRCTLTKADLADRQLKLSELAYGTDKAKDLFRDMMQQAAYQFGFEAEDIPLMIEAIPLSAECIILIITKVECPEELDTRFSKFAPPPFEDVSESLDSLSEDDLQDAAEVLDLFKKISDETEHSDAPVQEFIPLPAAINQAKESSAKQASISDNDKDKLNVILTKLYEFDDIEGLAAVGKVLEGFYQAPNSLYKSSARQVYTLLITKGNHTPEDYNKICNILSEYATPKKCFPGSIAFLDEHEDIIIRNKALQTLSELY